MLSDLKKKFDRKLKSEIKFSNGEKTKNEHSIECEIFQKNEIEISKIEEIEKPKIEKLETTTIDPVMKAKPDSPLEVIHAATIVTSPIVADVAPGSSVKTLVDVQVINAGSPICHVCLSQQYVERTWSDGSATCKCWSCRDDNGTQFQDVTDERKPELLTERLAARKAERERADEPLS